MTGMTTREAAYQALGYSQALLKINQHLQALDPALSMREALLSVITFVTDEATIAALHVQDALHDVEAEQKALA